jgi:hypothetical protein
MLAGEHMLAGKWSLYMRTLIVALCCLLLATACLSSGDTDGGDTGATATANIAAARTATAAARTPATDDTPAQATATPKVATATPTDDATPTNDAATATTGNDATETPSGASNADLEARLSEILDAVSEVRELEPIADVPKAIITRDQLRANLMELLAEEYSPEEAERDTLVLWLLRLVDDPELDLYQLQLDLLSEQVLGYYDDEADELFVVSDNDGLSALDEYTAAHELVHALQDQHFDLQQFHAEADTNADGATAMTALIEGDAVLASTNYALEFMDPAKLMEIATESAQFDSSVLESAPPYIVASLQFPYDQGTTFVTELYTTGGNDAIDAAFADPPTSTEQVMHPEKYLDETRDDGVEVESSDVSAALGEGWSQAYTNTLGEFDLSFMLRENGAADPDGGADGWGGSRFTLYTNADAAVLMLDTIWDSDAEAAEFATAVRETMPQLAVATDLWNVGDRFIGLVETGDGVVVVSGTDRVAVEAALAA